MGHKMTNAPVYFTVAQVRFNPILSLKTYLPDIQEQLRKAGYPDFRQGISMMFNISNIANPEVPQDQTPSVQQVERFMFSNMDKTQGFILHANSLSYQATKYERYDKFSNDFIKGLEITHKTIGLNFSERIGVRYLDAVAPKKGDELPQYLIPEVLGVAGLLQGTSIIHSFSESVVKTRTGGKVVSRTVIQNGHLGFPPDLQPDGLTVDDRFREIDGLHAVIDTDGSFENREPFDIANVKKRLDDLHDVIGAAFHSTVTKYAESVWG